MRSSAPRARYIAATMTTATAASAIVAAASRTPLPDCTMDGRHVAPVQRELIDRDGENRRCRNRQNRADQTPQGAADEQRHHDGDRADADAACHDLQHQDVRLEL